MPMKKAIENAKALIKHLQENPAELEKLNKARVDEGKPLALKVALRQNRNSREVQETRTPSGQKNRTMAASNKRAGELETKYKLQTPVGVFPHVPARRHGEKIVGKPKRLDEDKTGVHQHSSTFAQKKLHNKAIDGHGTFSEKGGKSHRLGGKYHAPGGAQTAHNDVMNAQAKIKPNLPKAEMQKGDYFRSKLGKAAHDTGAKGVHQPIAPKEGMSQVGFKTALAHADKNIADPRASNSKPFQAKMLSEAIGGHKKVIAQQAAMPKPNLPKAEMQKGAKDCCKEEWAPKFHKPAKSAGELVKEDWQPKFHSTGEIKGVNQVSSTDKKGGTSHAGSYVKGKQLALDSVSPTRVASKQTQMNHAKAHHKVTLDEQKAMPKPNLPKSEFKKEELHTGLDIVADAKAKSKEKSAKELSAQVKAAAKGSDTMEKAEESKDHNMETVKRYADKADHTFHYEKHKGTKGKPAPWHSIEVKDSKGEVKIGFGSHKVTPAIAEAIKHSKKGKK